MFNFIVMQHEEQEKEMYDFGHHNITDLFRRAFYTHHLAHQFTEAIELYSEELRNDPMNAHALHHRGLAKVEQANADRNKELAIDGVQDILNSMAVAKEVRKNDRLLNGMDAEETPEETEIHDMVNRNSLEWANQIVQQLTREAALHSLNPKEVIAKKL